MAVATGRAGLRPLVAGGVLLAGATALYLGMARSLTGAGGLPLDDSWIHQTLARNLAATGQMVIVPGDRSAAATAPLWSLLLAVAYWLGLPPLEWAIGLGVVCLAASAWLVYRFGMVLTSDRGVAMTAALLCLAEWRLLWAAMSGMDTLLFTVLSLAVLAEAATRDARRPWLLGGLVGLSAAARPEGLALAVLLAVWLVMRRAVSVRQAGALMAAAVVPLALVALLNLSQHGNPLPATFFAKNAAYAGGLDPGRTLSFLWEALLVLVRGPELLLVPGLVLFIAGWVRSRSGPGALCVLWMGGLTAAYALWLPALYHHGRYLFPLLPLALLLGVAGSRRLLDRLQLPRLALAGKLLLVLYAAYSGVRGAQAYAENVDLINRQQVWSARWVVESTPPGTVIAAHDIGALGYFGGRPLVDMAGLATPDLVSGPRDVAEVLRVVQARGARYALAIPDWYPPLYAGLTAGLHAREVAVAVVSPAVPDGQRLRILAVP